MCFWQNLPKYNVYSNCSKLQRNAQEIHSIFKTCHYFTIPKISKNSKSSPAEQRAEWQSKQKTLKRKGVDREKNCKYSKGENKHLFIVCWMDNFPNFFVIIFQGGGHNKWFLSVTYCVSFSILQDFVKLCFVLFRKFLSFFVLIKWPFKSFSYCFVKIDGFCGSWGILPFTIGSVFSQFSGNIVHEDDTLMQPWATQSGSRAKFLLQTFNTHLIIFSIKYPYFTSFKRAALKSLKDRRLPMAALMHWYIYLWVTTFRISFQF